MKKYEIGNNLSGRSKAIGVLINAEFDINDAPLSARTLLTSGHVKDEICKFSGVAITTRGRYMTPEERQCIASPGCRPLYLNVQASSHDAVKVAVHRIQKVIDQYVQISGIPKNPTVGVVIYPSTSTNDSFGLTPSTSTSHLPIGSNFVEDKVFVGFEQAPPDYPVREKILGPGGSFLQYIRTKIGAIVSLRGKGSGFIESTSGREALEPLYIHITHPKPEGLQAAKALAVNLIETAHVEFAQWQQAQQTILPPLTSAALVQATPVAYQNQGIPSTTVITYTTYVTNTNPVLVNSANSVFARPNVPAVNIIDVVPTMPAVATYTSTQPYAPFQNQQQLPHNQPVGYVNVPSPQASVSLTSTVMTVSDAANYSVATRFPVPVSEVQQKTDVEKHKFYNEVKGPEAHVEKELSPCLQESNVNHPTELPTRRGAMKRPAEDWDVIPPPPTTVSTSLTPINNEEVTVNDNQRRPKQLASLKAFSMYKAQFLSPDANQEALWQKITETANKLSSRNKPYCVEDFLSHMCSLKSKYDKLKNNKTSITTPKNAIFFEEAKLVFESTGSEEVCVDQILHDGYSERCKKKFERYLALLRAYNLYKAEFSSLNEDDESVWEKIAGTVRISCSLTHWSINDCRFELSQMKEKYEKKKRDWYLASQPEADILFEEEEMAFETVIYPEECEQIDLLTEINSDGV